MSKRRPKLDATEDGERVRVFTTRREYEVIFGDDDIDNPEAEVWCYPKLGTPETWAAQARAQRAIEQAQLKRELPW